jgi:hypothetical protein
MALQKAYTYNGVVITYFKIIHLSLLGELDYLHEEAENNPRTYIGLALYANQTIRNDNIRDYVTIE